MQPNPTGPAAGSHRVLRGGGWGSNPEDGRVAGRYDNDPTGGNNNDGFRPVRR